VDTPQQRTISGFRSLVESVEAAADRGPKAELARFQLQGLSATLAQLATDGVPTEVSCGLDVVRSFVESVGGADRSDGARLRDKVQAYALVADDLGLDTDELLGLVRRWDAATAPAPARSGAGRRSASSRPARERNAGPAGDQECDVCGMRFKRVAKHMSFAHPVEWARRKGG